jgi:hypothetical protein
MKSKILISLFFAVFILMAFGFREAATAILGKVNPVGGASNVLAISGKDTASSPIIDGVFRILAKPGIYNLTVQAIEPYKNVTIENVTVKEGQTIDLGEILLHKSFNLLEQDKSFKTKNDIPISGMPLANIGKQSNN